MPGTVVVPLDGSQFAERALIPAAEIARLSGARVIVVTARHGGVVSEPHHYLERVARAAGIVDPESVVVTDRLAASAIVSVVSESLDPIVCLATHARGRAGQALFGSVAEDTLRRANIPLVLVGPSVPGGPTHLEELVICVDGSPLADEIGSVGAAWAHEMRLDIVVVGVADSKPDAQRGTDAQPLSIADLENVASTIKAASAQVRCQLLHSARPADAIIEFAGGRPRAFLALATHGRTGLGRLTAGSVMMSVVRSAPCPVLTLRPGGVVG
jgi:nucleotide-binding universal stress UspA family protein